MIIDSSALVAIVLREPDYLTYIDRLAEARGSRMSAVSLLETSLVISRLKGPEGMDVLRQFIADAAIQIVEFSASQAQLAFRAHQRFGKGMGHPAQLNILDCCTYALAAEAGEPVLFKGSDFDKTDIAIA